MKKFPFLIMPLALLSLTLTQCVVSTVPVAGPVSYSTGYNSNYYGGYGVTGRVATNAMWAGVAAYGIHERNETRQNRVNYGVNNYHRSSVTYRGNSGAYHRSSSTYRGGGGRRR